MLPIAVIAPRSGRVVAVVARMDHHHLADAVLLNVLVDLVQKVEAGGLDADLHANLVLVFLLHLGQL